MIKITQLLLLQPQNEEADVDDQWDTTWDAQLDGQYHSYWKESTYDGDKRQSLPEVDVSWQRGLCFWVKESNRMYALEEQQSLL